MSDVSVNDDAHLSSLLQAVVVIFVAFAAALVVASLGGNLLLSLGVVTTDSVGGNVAVSVLQFVGFGVGIAGYFAVTDQWDLLRVRVPTMRDLGWIAGGVVVILLAAAVVGQLLSTLGVSVAENQVVTTGQQNPTFFLYMIPVSLLFVGPFEELVFRGTVQGVLRRSFGPAVAIALASTLFGLVHLVALTGTGSRLSYVAVAAVLGLILGVAYERTGNLVVPSVIHGGYNAVLFSVQYAVATGMVA
ncbi:MAG: CPBP family intramembrane glutamic endopeptidase [Halobacteriota archaeon]